MAVLTGRDVCVCNGVGWVGVFLFLYGVADLFLDLSLCVTLSSCGQVRPTTYHRGGRYAASV